MTAQTTPAAVLAPPAQWGVGMPVPTARFAELSEDELLTELETHEKVSAWIEARGLSVIEELTRRRERATLAELSERQPDASARARTLAVAGAREAVVDEIALATGASERTCTTRVRMAREWERFTQIRDALATGRMSAARAVQVTTRSSAVDAGRMPAIITEVLAPYDTSDDGDDGGLAVPQSVFSWRLGRAVAAATTCRQRHLDAIQRRDAWASLTPEADGAFTVTGHAARIAAAYGRVDDHARRLRREGDPRTLAQLRSDIGLDLLIEGHLPETDGHAAFGGALPAARVTVTISAASLLGANDAPGTIEAGTREKHLPAFIIRDLAYAHGSTWRRLVTDPATGVLRDLSTHRYQVTGELRERLIARDRYSRVPGSMRRAASCDLDHDIDHAAGGPSSESNLSAKNRRGHNHKTHHRWGTLREPTTDGAITWTTPTGRHYVTRPHDYRDPLPRGVEDPNDATRDDPAGEVTPPVPVENAVVDGRDTIQDDQGPRERSHPDKPRRSRAHAGAMIIALARNARRSDSAHQARARANHVEETGSPILREDSHSALHIRRPPTTPEDRAEKRARQRAHHHEQARAHWFRDDPGPPPF